MIKQNKAELDKSVEIMKLLNKAQKISRQLHKLGAEDSYLKTFDRSIFELSLTPTDIIGDNVYQEYLKKRGVKVIAEPRERGWYGVGT